MNTAYKKQRRYIMEAFFYKCNYIAFLKPIHNA